MSPLHHGEGCAWGFQLDLDVSVSALPLYFDTLTLPWFTSSLRTNQFDGVFFAATRHHELLARNGQGELEHLARWCRYRVWPLYLRDIEKRNGSFLCAFGRLAHLRLHHATCSVGISDVASAAIFDCTCSIAAAVRSVISSWLR